MKKIDNIQMEPDTLSNVLSDYKFQPELTQKLDQITSFTEINLLEVVLWKTNRYPEFDITLLEDLNMLCEDFTEISAKSVLEKMLGLRGFDLPMASTVLRFLRPDKFQIIDQRVYRFIMPGVTQMKIPHNKQAKIKFYFEYLERLRALCQEYNIDFAKSDRIFYQLDKVHNSNLPIKY